MKDKNDTTENTEPDEQLIRESIRPRHPCTGRLRHPRECACGRQRALSRDGRRWCRHETCRRCARASKTLATLVARNARKGGSHA